VRTRIEPVSPRDATNGKNRFAAAVPEGMQARFQIVLWDIGVLEPIAAGATLCTTGTITVYEGVPQIELRDPGAVEIYQQ
jgi:hypothetical protein